MRKVLVVPGALVGEPDWDEAGRALLARGALPVLDLLRRAPRRVRAPDAPWSDGAAHLHWLADAFQVPARPAPTAPYAWNANAGVAEPPAEPGQIWFCEPVHLVLRPERTVLSPIDRPGLDELEVRSLLEDAADSAREAGADLQVRHGRWYLRVPQGWDLQARPLQAVLGASVETRMPTGAGASHWRRLLNEIQMRWYVNAVNTARESRGQQTANALWLHGGGAWTALPASPFAEVESDDPVVLGWHRAGRPAGTAHDRADILTVWPQLFESYWRKDWDAWSRAWIGLQDIVLAHRAAPRSAGQRPLEVVACGRWSVAAFSLREGLARFAFGRRSLRECLVEAAS